MGKTKFSVDRKTFEELSLTESKLKSSTDFFDKKNLSSQERLFYRVWADEDLKLGVFEPGKIIQKKGEIPGTAFIITLGEAMTNDNEHEYFFGPGSVIGLAEGLCEEKSRYEFTANGVVNCKIIQIPSAMRELQLTNTGLKGICRMTLQRVLGEKISIPEYMK
tara:strand:- start:523 stop:1011 length:489 start_codon:yes stop_codon:yes gene_type:complete